MIEIITTRQRRAMTVVSLFLGATIALFVMCDVCVAGMDAPEAVTASYVKPPVVGHNMMVVSANPIASKIGFQTLEKGGSAIDAAIAVQLALGLVEPQSSGLGGGAFLLYYDAKKRALMAFDGRETAPAGVTPNLFIGADGKPMTFVDASVSGRSVGTPGVVRLLETIHRHAGRLPWKDVFQPAIQLAEQGFIISPRLAFLIANDQEALRRNANVRNYLFTPEGAPLQAGAHLANPAYAQTLRVLAENGPDAFYRGPIAADIIRSVRSDPLYPGSLSENDLSEYRVKTVEPLCGPYRVYRICSFPPPSSGGVAILQILGVLEPFALAPPNSTQAIHLIAEASKLAFADRNHYVADPAFWPTPTLELIDRGYLMQQSKRIDPKHAAPTPVSPGSPPQRQGGLVAPDDSSELPSTSHFIVVDRDGNIVSVTSSIENAFGSKIMTRGFFLNNQLTDFSFLPATSEGKPIANRIEPGKRPRSSMVPVIVFDKEQRPFMTVGSAGGPRIIGQVVLALIGVLDWRLNIQEALNLPLFFNRNSDTELEEGTPLIDLKPSLEAMGHRVIISRISSGTHGITLGVNGGLVGGADVHREGLAIGD
ncbi:gamma-glutamyltranspeptidase / glutathione hydrolase [Azospirillaceae bacterium]